MNPALVCPRCGAKKPPECPNGLCPACLFSAAISFSQPSPKPEPGLEHGKQVPEVLRKFGDYELLERLAEGGMGVVYKARQVRLNRLVAVKTIRSGRLANLAEITRFRTEAAAAAKLKHPNIVPIHEIGEVEGQHYFSLDLLEGGSLAAEVRRHPLAPTRAASIVRTLARAMQYAHEQGVLHRDLKPSNVLLDRAGEPHLTDFGLAKVIESTADLTRTGDVFGTPSYASPEQVQGWHDRVGPRSDVYSLGAILCELLTGHPPFTAPTVLETIRLVVAQEPPDIRSRNSHLPRDLATICSKCLAKNPADRYASARALEEELGRFLRDEPILARPTSSLERATRWCRREPKLAGSIGATTAVFLGALLVAFVLWRQAEGARQAESNERERSEAALRREATARQISEQRLYAADLSTAFQALREGSVAPAKALLDLHRSQTNLHDFAWHYLDSLGRGDQADELLGHSNAIGQIEFSPDQGLIASRDTSDHLIVWDMATRRQRFALDGISSLAGFLPNQRGLVVGTTDNSARILDVEDGALRRRRPGAGRPLSVLPDGRTISCSSAEALLQLWSLASDDLHVWVSNRWDQLNPGNDSKPILFDRGQERSAGLEPDPLAWNREAERISILFPREGQLTNAWICWLDRTNTTANWIPTNPDAKLSCLSPSGRSLLVGRKDGVVERFALSAEANQRSHAPFQAHQTQINALAFLPNETDYVTGGADHSLRLWSMGSEAPWRTLLGHRDGITAITVATNGTLLASGGRNGELFLWNLSTRPGGASYARVMVRQRQDRILFSPDSRQIAMRTAPAGKTLLLDAATMLERSTLSNQWLPAYFSSDGDTLVLGATTHRKFNLATSNQSPKSQVEFPTLRGLLERDSARTNLLAKVISPSRRFAAFSVASVGVIVCDASDGDEVLRIPPQAADYSDLAFFPLDDRLALIDLRGHVRIWDPTTRAEVATFQADPGINPSILPLANGATLATSGSPNTVKIWDARSGDWLATLRGHREEVISLACSHDGKTLASGSVDGVVKLWNLLLGQEVGWFIAEEPPSSTGTRHAVRQLAFSPDDRVLAALNSSGRLIVWRGRTGTAEQGPTTSPKSAAPPSTPFVETLRFPNGWNLVQDKDFSLEPDQTVRHGGRASARLFSNVQYPQKEGLMEQVISAVPFRGQQIQLDGYVRTELFARPTRPPSEARLQLRVASPAAPSSYITWDDMRDRPIRGTNDWTHYSLNVDVPLDATRIYLACSLVGQGSVWIDDLQFGPVARTVELTRYGAPFRAHPVNLDFEDGTEDSASGRLHGWTRSLIEPGVDIRTDAQQPYAGARSMRLHRDSNNSSRTVRLYQEVQAAPLAGKRIRFNGWARATADARGCLALSVGGPGNETISQTWDCLTDGPNWNSWKPLSVVVDVPPDARSLSVECTLLGIGDAWFDELLLEPAAADLPLSPHRVHFREFQNLDFAELDGSRPRFWQMETNLFGSDSRKYSFSGDTNASPESPTSLRLESVADAQNSFGAVSQKMSAKAFVGKHIQFSGRLRTEEVTGSAALWLRIDGEKKILALHNMGTNALSGTTDWTSGSVALDVPEEAKELTVGGLLAGNGKVWFANLRFADSGPAQAPPPPVPSDPPSHPRQFVNLGFEDRLSEVAKPATNASASEPPRPQVSPWVMANELRGSRVDQYQIATDTQIARSGRASLRLESQGDASKTFGAARQTVDATDYRGKRLRLSGYLRTQDVEKSASLWFRVDGKSGITIAFDNMGTNGLTGTTDWTRCSLVLDVAPEAKQISCGGLLVGTGKIWLDDLQVEVVGAEIPLTDILPRELRSSSQHSVLLKNPSFDDLTTHPAAFLSGAIPDPTPDGWSFKADGEHHSVRLETNRTHSGKGSALLTSSSATPEGSGSLYQTLSAKSYLGQRVSWSASLLAESTESIRLWVKVRGAQRDLSVDNEMTVIRSGLPMNWKTHALIFEVPSTAETISVGCKLLGPGRLGIDDGKLELVLPSTPVTPQRPPRPPKASPPALPDRPVNLDFEDLASPDRAAAR